jgi:dienelactone hydrolase
MMWRFHRLNLAPAMAVFATLVTVPQPALAASDLIEDRGFLRVNLDGHDVRLEGLIVKRADAEGRLPIALIVHGKPADLGNMEREHTDSVVRQARDLAARGWLAVAAMHRGFGQSDGPYPPGMTCDPRALVQRLNSDADELAAVLSRVTQRPDADATRIIVIGVSAGGADAVALAARNPPGLLAVVSVSGGLQIRNCPTWQDNLVAAEKAFGALAKMPQLWLYARNDSFFEPGLVERMRSAALDGGADIKLVMFNPMGSDGHDLFGMVLGRVAWLRELDAFLRYLKLPTWQLQEVDSVIAKAKAEARSKPFVEGYFSAPREKVLAHSQTTNSFWDGFGSPSLDEARSLALKSCATKASDCSVVMENERFVDQP